MAIEESITNALGDDKVRIIVYVAWKFDKFTDTLKFAVISLKLNSVVLP